MGSGRGWFAGDQPSTGGVLNITVAVWTAGFRWWCSGNITRTQNVSEYMLVLAVCLVVPLADFLQLFQKRIFWECCHRYFAGQMLFLSPNKESTEVNETVKN